MNGAFLKENPTARKKLQRYLWEDRSDGIRNDPKGANFAGVLPKTGIVDCACCRSLPNGQAGACIPRGESG